MKNYINKHLLFFKVLVLTLLSCILVTTLEMFFLSEFMSSTILLLSFLSFIFYYGYNKGKLSKDKGYKTGLKLGITLCLILFMISVISLNRLKISMFFYYILILAISEVSSIIGKNKSCSR